VWSRYWLPSTVTSSNLPALKLWRTLTRLFMAFINSVQLLQLLMRATLRHNVRPSGRKTYTQNCLIGPMIFRVMSTALTYYFFSAVVSLKRAIFSKWVSSLIAHTQDGFVDETFRTDSILRTQIGNLSLKRDPAHHSEFSGAICRSLHRVEHGGQSCRQEASISEWKVLGALAKWRGYTKAGSNVRRRSG
jgi:hypothetical protein